MENTWKSRLAKEQEELNERIIRLEGFIETPAFDALPHEDQLLLGAQNVAMLRYNRILLTRIARAE